ncbi:flagellar M-ring protein FliF [Peptoclostridium acidaminophilum DSM 3953]|uniref:Flagellar M-ring protein n=1 Tax=Peptoclostridium acidaminophilum DSM 3953 TaxID=1286171 RepID=W8T4K1_PEPAC|nr:flagellar M-ring protein FliF [Peptoclostridium acidaminophilum DSM 3953]
MEELFSNIKHKSDELTKKYTKKQKTIFLICSILLVLTVTFTIFYITRPEYVVLYKDLKPEETGAITQNLDETGVKYKIQDEGTILVAEGDASKARIDLSMKGVPSRKFSYEDVLNKNNIFLSKEEKQQAFNIALKNSLAQDIESMPGIESAIVNITIPQGSDFILSENKDKTKSAVWIKMKSGQVLEPDRIAGIAEFVSNSVEGLEVANVTIHDASGKVLNGEKSGESNMSNSQIELQEEVKSKVQESLMEFLGPVYGYSNVSVMASVKLDFDTTIRESKSYNTPVEGEESGLIRSLQEKRSSSSATGEGGPAGTESNTDTDATTQYAEQQQSSSTQNDNEEKVVNYELNETIEKLEKAKGQIKDITVAVIINSEILEGKELDEEQKSQVEKIVSTAVGLDAKAVEVYARTFDDSMNKAFEDAAKDSADNMPVWIIALIIILILIPAAGAVIYFARKKIQRQALPDNVQATLEIPEEEIKELEVDIKDSGYKKSIESLIERNPEIASQLLKSWLSED